MSWTIDTDFPGANACGGSLDLHRGAVALSIAADPRQSPEALWFHVRLRRTCSAAEGDAAPWLIVRHVDTLLGGGDGSGLRPVARCDGGEWQRLAPGEPLRHGDGRCDVAWRLPDAAVVVEVAFCLSYAEAELSALLSATRGRLHFAPIGSSEHGRPLLRVANRAGEVGGARPGIYLLARQHAGETPGSWVLDGLLRRIADLGDTAPLVWAIPFVDTDGVLAGDYGKDRHAVDYNRSWWRMGRRHEVACIQGDIARWRQRCVPRLCLDLHAPGASEADGCYGYVSLSGATPTPAAEAWCARLGTAIGAPYASGDFTRRGSYPSRWPSETHPSFTAWAAANGLPALSLEIPYQGTGGATWSMAEYREIGRRIADALCAPEQ